MTVIMTEQDVGRETDAATTCEDLGRLVIEFDQQDAGASLFERLRRLLGHSIDPNPASAPHLDEDRTADVRHLVEGIERVLTETKWSPADFRQAVGCDLAPADVYSEIDLDRCLGLLDLIGLTLDDVEAADDQARRVAILMTVEAYRAAQGDNTRARRFWAEPTGTGVEDLSSLAAVIDGRHGAALLAIARHARTVPVGSGRKVGDALHNRTSEVADSSVD